MIYDEPLTPATTLNLAGEELLYVTPEAPGFAGEDNLKRLIHLGIPCAKLWIRLSDKTYFIGEPPDHLAIVIDNGRGLVFIKGVTNK